ncbi:MAG: helix-turn-helix domain-containing protein [Clostridium sp.]
MRLDRDDLKDIQSLVGYITEENLKCVDCYVSPEFGLFIPSVGFCEYAISPQHVHPAYSFVLFFSEEQSLIPVKIEVLPNNYLATALAPNLPHEEKEDGGFTRYIAIFISKEFYEKSYRIYRDEEPEIYEWNQFLVNKDIMMYIKNFMVEYENKSIGYKEILHSLANVITHKLIRNIIKIEISSELYTEKFDIDKVIEYMNQNYEGKLTIDNLAKIAKMSESNFIRVFKKETKLTPIEYLIKLRLEKAKKLLRGGTKTITEIALQCGFNSTSHFSSCFRKQYGNSPTEYKVSYLK